MPPAFPESDAALLLPGPAGALETDVEHPPEGVARREAIAVICHPLPTEGGTKENKVVTMAARSLRELGIATVRFNFRGAGASEGSYDHGHGEQDDLRAVVAWVRATRPDKHIWLGGFSFGAYVSLCVQQALAPAALISIAPPAGRWDFSPVSIPQMPWLVVQGEADEIVDAQAVEQWFDAVAAPQGTLERLPETSHFFHRKLLNLRAVLQDWASGVLHEDATAHA